MTFGTKKNNIPPRETVSAAEPNMPRPVWGENILSCLAGGSEFQYIFRIPCSLRNQHFSGTDLAITLFLSESFFTLTAATQKILHTESALKRQAVLKHFYNPKPALFLDERIVAVSSQHKQTVYLKQS